MSYIVKIKNDTITSQTWVGKAFAAAEEYQVSEAKRSKWASNSTLLTAISNSEALVGDGSEYFTDISKALDWLKGTNLTPSDTDGVPLSRTKVTKTGWHYQANSVEFSTAKLSSLVNIDAAGDDLGYTTIKYYDVVGVELVAGTQGELDTDCVKTVITWEPGVDYEIIGGTLYQSAAPSNDVRLWITAVPDLTPAQGGSIPFMEGGMNLKHMGTGAIMELDGKTPKLMTYNATYHTSKFQITATHTAGDQCPVMVVLKVFLS